MIRERVPVPEDELPPDREPTTEERKICSDFIMFYGSSAGDVVEDAKLASRALDFYAHPDNHRALRNWIQELGVGVNFPPDPKLLDRMLGDLARRAPQKADELRALGWDIPKSSRRWFAR